MQRWKKITLIVLGVGALGFSGMAFGFSYPVTEEEINEQFITASPVDLSQVAAFSKFRSCIGHDYRAPMAETGRVESTPRSLKHYIKVKPQFRGTLDRVYVYAPFDGTISEIDDDRGGPGDQQVWLTPSSANPALPRQWHFIFFHVSLNSNLREGSRVTAGEKIGTANLMRGPDEATDNFDIALKFTRPMHQPAIDAVFSHMSAELLSQYATYGITPQKLVLDEAYRDVHECPALSKGPIGPEYDPDTIYFLPSDASNEYVFLRNNP